MHRGVLLRILARPVYHLKDMETDPQPPNLNFSFIGTCARKQSFVTAYALFLYFHLAISIAVAAYFLWQVTSTADDDIVQLCEEGLQNDQTKDQCSDLLNITKAVYWIVAVLILSIEACASSLRSGCRYPLTKKNKMNPFYDMIDCAIVVTRFVNQLKYEKRDGRRSRIMQRQSAYDAFHARFGSFGGDGTSPHKSVDEDVEGEGGLAMDLKDKRYSAVSTSEDMGMDKEGLLGERQVQQRAFDPYEAYDTDSTPSLHSKSKRFELSSPPPPRSLQNLNIPEAGEEAGARASFSSEATTLRPDDEDVVGGVRSSSPLPPGAAPAAFGPGSHSYGHSP